MMQGIVGALVGAAVSALAVYAAMDSTRMAELEQAVEQGRAEGRAAERLARSADKGAEVGARGDSPAWYCIDMGLGSGGCFPSPSECEADMSDESFYGDCVRIRNPRVACVRYSDILAGGRAMECRYTMDDCELSRGRLVASGDYAEVTECEPTEHPDAGS